MSRLAIWMDGAQVATLERRGRTLSVAYAPEVLAAGLGRPLLSVSMPTQERPYTGRVPAAFFDGLLPEGEARRMIAFDFGVDDTAFDLLAVIGRDCAGALVILPEGEALPEPGTPEPLTDDEVAERLRRLPVAPLGVDQRVRVSLAGMQHKLLLAHTPDGWALPAGGAPSTHIVKPASLDIRFPELVANEAFCLRVAHHLGLPAAFVERGVFGGTPVLIVERYDRTPPNAAGHVSRIHQEDFCQARGHDGTRSRKCESEGGPSLRQCARTLDDWTGDPGQLVRLLDLTVLNTLVGNADAHAKNISLLHHPSGRVELAPVYDVFASTWYPSTTREPAMRINGLRDIHAVTRADLVAEARSWGVRPATAEERIDALPDRADEAIAQAEAEIGPPGELVKHVRARARELGLPTSPAVQLRRKAANPNESL